LGRLYSYFPPPRDYLITKNLPLHHGKQTVHSGWRQPINATQKLNGTTSLIPIGTAFHAVGHMAAVMRFALY
jgi:hypothetical protein